MKEEETKDVKVTPTTEDKSASLVTGVQREVERERTAEREDDNKDG